MPPERNSRGHHGVCSDVATITQLDDGANHCRGMNQRGGTEPVRGHPRIDFAPDARRTNSDEVMQRAWVCARERVQRPKQRYMMPSDALRLRLPVSDEAHHVPSRSCLVAGEHRLMQLTG